MGKPESICDRQVHTIQEAERAKRGIIKGKKRRMLQHDKEDDGYSEEESSSRLDLDIAGD